MVDTALERRTSHELDQYEPIDTDYRILDVYAGGVADEEPRIEALATISAGTKNEKGIPVRSTDGRIYLHDPNVRAPGLQAALEETAYRKLTIAFPSNDLSKVVQQRYACYSATALRAYGDEHTITVLEGGRRDYAAGTREYETWLKQCKVQASFYFCMAGWVDGEPIIDLPDGFGYYRLRTTSRNSLRSLISTLQHIMRFTGDRIAGIPFELSIEQRDVAGADGKRQKVPVWVMVMRPPGGLTLNSRTLQRINRQALAAGESLMLPAPSRESIDDALTDVAYVDDGAIWSEDAVAAMQRGGYCDADHWRKTWHATVKDTYLAADDERHAFLDQRTNGECDSLSQFLSTATDAEASALVVAAAEAIADWRARLDSDAVESEIADPSFADLVREPITDEPRSVLTGTDTELVMVDQWKQSVQLRMSKARTGANLTPVDEQDRRWLGRVIPPITGGDKARALTLLRDLTGRAVTSSADLCSGEASVLRDIIASPTQRPLLDRLANPQGALV